MPSSSRWITFVDSLAREGGHILICLVLLGIGATFAKFGISKADDVIIAALAILGRSMGGAILTAERDAGAASVTGQVPGSATTQVTDTHREVVAPAPTPVDPPAPTA